MIWGVFVDFLNVFCIFRSLKITAMGKLNVSYSGDETDASMQRGEFPPTFFLTTSVFVDPFLKFRQGQGPGQGPGRAQAGPGPGPGRARDRKQAVPKYTYICSISYNLSSFHYNFEYPQYPHYILPSPYPDA